MKRLAVGVAFALALALCAPALAKFAISVGATDASPATGQRVTFVVRTGRALDYDLRLVAVAPGKPIFQVVATITGDTSHPDPNIARDGFEIRLVRAAPNRWKGTARFPTRGAWRVVVPNGAAQGVALPAGVARLTVSVH
jgi:hypothetical protein